MSHTINTLIAEDNAYHTWEREQKNRILNMTNSEKKQQVWHKMFGVKQERSDDYLLGNIF